MPTNDTAITPTRNESWVRTPTKPLRADEPTNADITPPAQRADVQSPPRPRRLGSSPRVLLEAFNAVDAADLCEMVKNPKCTKTPERARRASECGESTAVGMSPAKRLCTGPDARTDSPATAVVTESASMPATLVEADPTPSEISAVAAGRPTCPVVPVGPREVAKLHMTASQIAVAYAKRELEPLRLHPDETSYRFYVRLVVPDGDVSFEGTFTSANVTGEKGDSVILAEDADSVRTAGDLHEGTVPGDTSLVLRCEDTGVERTYPINASMRTPLMQSYQTRLMFEEPRQPSDPVHMHDRVASVLVSHMGHRLQLSRSTFLNLVYADAISACG